MDEYFTAVDANIYRELWYSRTGLSLIESTRQVSKLTWSIIAMHQFVRYSTDCDEGI